MSQKSEEEDCHQIIRGFMFPYAQYSSRKTLEEVLDYLPHDGDIIIASYPKTGSTWLQYIVLQILSCGTLFPSFDDVLYKLAPLMEVTGVKTVEEMEEPRIYKHHCPYHLVQRNSKSKYLYIYRKPEDTLISYFHFTKSIKSENYMDLDTFFERFLSGNISYGSYFEHVQSYLQHKDDKNLMFISYENLYLNRRQEILRIAKFLSEECHMKILENDLLFDSIIKKTSFEYMKMSLNPSKPKHWEQGTKMYNNFFRKGIIGDGKHSLSSLQIEKLQKTMEELMRGTDILKEWQLN